MKKMSVKEKRIVAATLGCWGILFIGSGFIMNINNKPVIQKNYLVSTNLRRVEEAKTNEIKLKDMELEINQPLSVDIKDYLEDIQNLDESILKALKLDTSMVNINEAGTYTYTITYKKKKYNGTFKIKEKQLPKVAITLKNLKLEKGSALSTNLSTYIVENLSEEVKKHITLDLTAVNTMQPAIYQYTVTYDGKLYTATIEIYEPHTTVLTPNKEENSNTENSNTGTEESKKEEEQNPE